jgi:cytochrome c oxidase subunit III
MLTEVKLRQFENTPLGDRGQRKKIHPHKFTLWIAVGSIVMMFAGLTSAYIVKSNQASWQPIEIPKVFWYSTVVILISSLTVQLSLLAFKNREMNRYRILIAITTILGVLFIALQYLGFRQLWNSGITLRGSGAGQFLYVIAGLHAAHVVGGIVVLVVMFIKAFFGASRNYSSVPVELAATYWHFVDFLWIYLFVFFMWIG